MEKNLVVQNASTAISADLLDELSRDADSGLSALSSGPEWIRLKGGRMSYGGVSIDSGSIVSLVLGSVLENSYYDKQWSPDLKEPPVCFAIGEAEKTMVPHDNSASKQNADCASCKWHKFGSANIGKGRACRTYRRLALIPAGYVEKDKVVLADAAAISSAPIALMRVPPTQLGQFDRYVKTIAITRRLPSYAVFTRIDVKPDDATILSLSFSFVGSAVEQGADTIAAIRGRLTEAKSAATTVAEFREDVSDDESGGDKVGAAPDGKNNLRKSKW